MVWLLAGLLSTASAHKPAIGGEWDEPTAAFPVADPEISIVVYRELTCEQPALWLAFDATAGDEVWVQLGVPVISRLAQDRPAMALLAPGLPPIDGDVPFAVPEGLGGVIIESGTEAADFYEPFTQTYSWIWAETWVNTPESGQAYLVGWNPEGRSGKLWLAMGTVEDFSDLEWSSAAALFGDIADFHETSGEAEVIEEECPGGGIGGCGCQAAFPASSGGLFALLGLFGLRRRR